MNVLWAAVDIRVAVNHDPHNGGARARETADKDDWVCVRRLARQVGTSGVNAFRQRSTGMNEGDTGGPAKQVVCRKCEVCECVGKDRKRYIAESKTAEESDEFAMSVATLNLHPK